MKIDMTSIFYAEGGPIWIKFRRLVQNGMSTAVIWSKSKPEAELQYGVRFSEFNTTLKSERIPSAILKIVFFAVVHFLSFLNAVCALASGSFRIIFDTLVFF